ncbi:MAG: glycosyltransferase [Fimbriimonadaceae bacterium]|nr:glycosyltransferase [Fimbriimonadaceae bacterium]
MSPTHVLLVVEATSGGCGKHTIDLGTAWLDRGLHVTLYYGTRRIDADFREFAAQVEARGGRSVAMDIATRPGFGDRRWFGMIRSECRALPRGTIVHGMATTGGFLARMAGARLHPVVYTPHSFVTMMPYVSPKMRRVYGLMEQTLSRRTDAIICVSEAEREHGRSLGIADGRLRVVYNGIGPIATRDRGVVRAEWGVGPEELVVGFVGRFDPPKRPELAVEAFARSGISDRARLVMVGDGSLAASVEAAIARLGLAGRVIRLGAVSAGPILSGFDLHLMTSDGESLPYVLVEAQAMAQPIVATDVGAVREIVADGVSGYVLPAGDADGLARRLRELADDAGLRARMSDAAHRSGERFGLGHMVEGTWRVYGDLLSARYGG